MSVPGFGNKPSSLVTSGSPVRGDPELYPTAWSRDSHLTIHNLAHVLC